MAHWEMYGNFTVGIWRYNGAWIKIRDVVHDLYQKYTTDPGAQPVVEFQFTYGINDVTGMDYFGAGITAHDGVSCSVDQILSLTWSYTTSSSETTAASGGKKTTVIVRPQ